jgi:hypothetical protein
MKNLLLFLLISTTSFAQNKKEQIEAINHSVDSLNTVLATTRDNSLNEISSLRDKIKEVTEELTKYQASGSKMMKENEKLKFDLEELSKKNLELEAKLKATEVELINQDISVPLKAPKCENVIATLVEEMIEQEGGYNILDWSDDYQAFCYNGKPFNGAVKMCWDNGNLGSLTTYINGLKTNSFGYNGDGNLSDLETFNLNGRREGEQLSYYFGTDQVISRTMYVNGKREGKSYRYYRNGTVKSIRYHQDDKLNGVQKDWHENGRLMNEINYKDGHCIDNKVIYYDEDGTIYKTEHYENGRVVQCEGRECEG